MNVPADSPGAPRAGARWSLLFGNFVIGCGVMAVQGTLNDIARSLAVSIALAGRLIAAAAGVMAAAQTRARHHLHLPGLVAGIRGGRATDGVDR